MASIPVVFLILDSFRQDHVRFYNPASPCETPHLDALARESVAFDNCYPEGLPTVPVRTCWLTGERTLVHRPWQPLTPEDRSLPEILTDEGYLTACFTDCYHYFKPGMNLHRGFRVWEWIRGQEYDAYRSGPLRHLRLEDHIKDSFSPSWRRVVEAALRNVDEFRTAEDHYCARLARAAGAWLDANSETDQPIFMWADSFDPHEPWTPPPEFDRYTDPHYTGKRCVLPPGGPAAAHFDAREIAFIRGLYAGECAYVDHYMGVLLQKLKQLGLYDRALIVLLADHGHPLADHGKFLKGGDRLYNELLKVPFMIRLPGGQGARRTQAIVQFHDVLPTLLELLGMGNDATSMHGRSFLPVLKGNTDEHRQTIITGYHEAIDRCVRDRTWSLILRPEGEPDELYDLVEDSRERVNLIDQHPEEACRLARAFGSYFRMQAQRVPSRLEVKGVQGKYELASGSIE